MLEFLESGTDILYKFLFHIINASTYNGDSFLTRITGKQCHIFCPIKIEHVKIFNK